ncbi:MAG: LytR C-terminal domain-containing protein [Patescibacteria group bacterium]
MPAFKFPSSILYLASEPSFFAILEGDSKKQELKDVTRIDFPLIEKGIINKENFVHALKSLEQKSIHLVASDDIFYHHISDYVLDAKKNIEEEIKETVSTVFADKKEPLHIVTVDLAKTSKMQTVQITAMTKANLATLAEASEETGVKIESIIPASFVVKAFVSVDPSLFLLATPQSFLLTSHYIGVDFAQNLESDEAKELINTVKTLKKERPHIQHIYICADPDTLSSLKEDLTEVLPIQDVEVKDIKSELDTPFFLKALTQGVKEVVENDFPLPHFSIQNAEPRAEKKTSEEKKEMKEVAEALEDIKEKETVEPIAEILKEVKAEEKKKEQEEKEEETQKETVEANETAEEESKPQVETETEVKTSIEVKKVVESVDEPTLEAPKMPAPTVMPVPKLLAESTMTSSNSPRAAIEKEEVAPKTIEAPAKVVVHSGTTTTVSRSTNTTTKPVKKMNVFRYLLLTLGVALAISLVGGGIVISQQALSDKNNSPLQTPISSVSPTEAPDEKTPTPEPTAPPIDLKKLDVLILNATSIAGKAGKTAAAIKKAGANSVVAGNAKDKYETGTYIMFAKPDLAGAKSELEKVTELSFDEKEMSAKENPDDKYDVVVILNE